MLEPTRIKKQGKSFKRKIILINFERIKKIPCPLKLLNLHELKTTFENVADILLTAHDNPLISLMNPDLSGEKLQRDSFLDIIGDPVVSNHYPTKCDTFKNNRIYFSQLRNAVNNKSPIKFMSHKNNVFLFDHEKVIQIKSNFEATCSYGDTLSFLYYKQNPTENRSLNLGSQKHPDCERKGNIA